MSELLLFEVAKLLLKRWKPKLSGDRSGLLPSPLLLAGGLERLLQRNPPVLDLISKITEAKKVDLDLIENEIKSFQKDLGPLVFDGILGNKTLSAVLSSLFCIKDLPKPSTLLPPDFQDFLRREKNETRFDNWYLYHIEDVPQVPGVTNVDSLIMNAWSLWMEFADVKVQRLTDDQKSAANVILKTADLSGTVLGQAHIGDPPGKFVLEIEMDRTRQWDKDLFEGAVAHEIGHVLGLTHQEDSGLLMSPVVPRNWREKTDRDGKRAAGLRWLGPAKPREVVQPTPGGLVTDLGAFL